MSAVARVRLATTDNIIGPVRTVLTLQSNVTLTAMTAKYTLCTVYQVAMLTNVGSGKRRLDMSSLKAP